MVGDTVLGLHPYLTPYFVIISHGALSDYIVTLCREGADEIAAQRKVTLLLTLNPPQPIAYT